jgi:cytoskeleton protein RodZ
MGGAVAGIGEALRSTRERRGLSIAEVAQDTRISPRFLEALEAEQFDELPAPVYVRGFIRSYASYLKIESQPLLDQLVGGESNVPGGATGGYVRGNGNGRPNGAATAPRRTDPFQRNGVVTAPTQQKSIPQPPPVQVGRVEDEGDAWSPDPPAPFTPGPVDHGYIPGSDLMEAPEHSERAYEYEEPTPIYRPRTAGVLAERPPSPGEPGIPRKVALFGAGVAVVLIFLAGAVFLTRGNDNGGAPTNAAASNPTAGVTPGTVIIASRSASPTASASPSASVSPSPTPSASTTATTAPETATPATTAAPGTATATTTLPAPTKTPVPAATATSTPPPPTPVPVRPEGNGFSECTPTNGTYDCGAPPYRVICYAPLGFPQNHNWWVDVDRSFGTIPDGWREYDGLLTNGQIINAGQSLCATP